MTTIQNAKITERIGNEAKLQELEVPRVLSNQIVPVLISNPEYQIKVARGVASDAVGQNIFTSSSSKSTYIIGAELTYTKDVNATSVYSYITATPVTQGSKQILELRYEPLTAGNGAISLTLNHPLKIEKGSAVTLSNSAAVASIDVVAIVYYYEIEDIKTS